MPSQNEEADSTTKQNHETENDATLTDKDTAKKVLVSETQMVDKLSDDIIENTVNSNEDTECNNKMLKESEAPVVEENRMPESNVDNSDIDTSSLPPVPNVDSYETNISDSNKLSIENITSDKTSDVITQDKLSSNISNLDTNVTDESARQTTKSNVSNDMGEINSDQTPDSTSNEVDKITSNEAPQVCSDEADVSTSNELPVVDSSEVVDTDSNRTTETSNQAPMTDLKRAASPTKSSDADVTSKEQIPVDIKESISTESQEIAHDSADVSKEAQNDIPEVSVVTTDSIEKQPETKQTLGTSNEEVSNNTPSIQTDISKDSSDVSKETAKVSSETSEVKNSEILEKTLESNKKPDVSNEMSVESNQTFDNTAEISKKASSEAPKEMSEGVVETASESIEPANGRAKVSAPMILHLYDEKLAMTCEIKTDNLNVLEIEGLSKDMLCGTEFMVEMDETQLASLDAGQTQQEDNQPRPNALAPGNVVLPKPDAISAPGDPAPSGDSQPEATPKKRGGYRPRKSLKMTSPSKDTPDVGKKKGKSRLSLPNLSGAAESGAVGKKVKGSGTPKKTVVLGKVGGVKTKVVGGKRAKSLGNLSGKSPARGVRKPKINLDSISSDETYKIPLLEHGWFRELVNRKATTPAKKVSDIYYFSPEPERKKYRSRNEIARILTKNSGLTVEHFTFSKVLLGLGPEYERERDAVLPGGASPQTVAPGKIKSTPKAKARSSPKKPTPSPAPPETKRVPRKSAKLITQEETDKENESVASDTPLSARIAKKDSTSAKKKSLPAETNEDQAPVKGKKAEKETPKRRKSVKSAPLDDSAEEPKGESIFDDSFEKEEKKDMYPRIKLKISGGLIEKPKEKQEKGVKSSVVLKEKNSTPVTSGTEGRVKKTPLSEVAKKSVGKVPLKKESKDTPVMNKESKKEKEVKTPSSPKQKGVTPKMGPKSSKPSTAPSDKGRKSLERSSSARDKTPSEDQKVAPLALTITKSPQKTIVSIKKSTDGKKPEIKVEIRKPSAGSGADVKKEESKSASEKKSEKLGEKKERDSGSSDENQDAKNQSGEAKKSKSFFDTIKTRKRSGFTLSQEECDIISGAKRAKTSPSGKTLTSPDISREEHERLSSVKVMLSPCRRRSTGKESPAPAEPPLTKKRKIVKTLEAEFDKIDKELLTAPPANKRKRSDKAPETPKGGEKVDPKKAAVGSSTKGDSKVNATKGDLKVGATKGDSKVNATKGDLKVGATKGNSKVNATKSDSKVGNATKGDSKVGSTGGNSKEKFCDSKLKGKSVIRDGDKRKSKDKKEIVMNGGVDLKENQESRRLSTSHSTPSVPPSGVSATKLSSLFSDPSRSNPLYKFLVHLMSFLTVQDRLRLARVNKLFNLAAEHKTLWTHVRMKNSRVQDWSGCAASFCRHNTEVLDMKKMITPSGPDDQISMWSKLPSHLGQIGTLKHVDLGKCSSHVFENLKDHLSQLLSLSATLHRGQPVVLSHFSAMKNLVKLKLKGYEIKKGAQNIFAVNHLSHLTQLRHLALTSVGNLNHTTLDSIISQCPQLTALELGSCANLTAQDATKLLRLSNLQKLRLEIVVSEASSAFVEAASRLEHLSHLELINVDVTEGFDVSLGLCTRLRTLIIIPTYVSQSAVTNYLLLSGIAKLQTTLRLVSWGLTMELLKVTDMFAAKWKGPNQFKSDGTCVPVMSPIPVCYLADHELPANPAEVKKEVDLFPISKLRKLLTGYMKTNGVSIFTVSYSNTLRHTMMDRL
ncbi:hypothetical protein M8J77_021838 [Diaphorina citri]|nr:hypothetical protein M8J77_021838 [Diaphorina citri]